MHLHNILLYIALWNKIGKFSQIPKSQLKTFITWFREKCKCFESAWCIVSYVASCIIGNIYEHRINSSCSTCNTAPWQCTWKSNRRWCVCLSPCHPHGRTELCLWLLTSPWSITSHVGHLWSKPVNLFVSHSLIIALKIVLIKIVLYETIRNFMKFR